MIARRHPVPAGWRPFLCSVAHLCSDCSSKQLPDYSIRGKGKESLFLIGSRRLSSRPAELLHMDGEDNLLFLHRAVFALDVPCLSVAIHFHRRALIELGVLDALGALAGRGDAMPRYLVISGVLGNGETGDQAALVRLLEVGAAPSRPVNFTRGCFSFRSPVCAVSTGCCDALVASSDAPGRGESGKVDISSSGRFPAIRGRSTG